MLDKISFLVIDSAILAAVIFNEVHPDVYIRNIVVASRMYLTGLALLVWLHAFVFAVGSYDAAMVKKAIAMTVPDRRLAYRLLNRVSVIQDCTIMLTSVLCGQWFILTAFAFILFSLSVTRALAKMYLARVPRVQPKTKTAVVIDVA